MAAAKAQPLTADEQKQLKALQDKAANADWQAKEDERLAKLDALKPLADVLTTEQVNTMIAGLRDARNKLTDVDVAVRVDRLIQSLQFDGLGLTGTIDGLGQPTPKAVEAPTEATPAPTPTPTSTSGS